MFFCVPHVPGKSLLAVISSAQIFRPEIFDFERKLRFKLTQFPFLSETKGAGKAEGDE
jgi:hypothetical protein